MRSGKPFQWSRSGGAAHERTIRELRLGPGGVRIGKPLRQFEGVLTGVPTYRGESDSLLKEEDREVMYRQNEHETRVLILAPTGRDAFLLSSTLATANINSHICSNAVELLEQLKQGASAVLVTEEALSPSRISDLAAWLTTEPPWSDMPFLVLTARGRANAATTQRAQALQQLGNVTFLERPVRPETIEAAVRTALRARMRQHEIRRRQEMLTRLNADLEQFAYSASHDLQEPIRNIAIYSELLTRRYNTVLDARGQEFLGYVHEGARRMGMLVEDLLAYTKAASITDELPDPIEAEEALQAAL